MVISYSWPFRKDNWLFIPLLCSVLLREGAHASGQLSSTDWSDLKLVVEGSSISEATATSYESELGRTPGDVRIRAKLLGYYFIRQSFSHKMLQARIDHIKWFVQNRPESDIGGSGYSMVDPNVSGNEYKNIRDLWLKKTKENPNDMIILSNTIDFVFSYDKTLGIRLINRAMHKEPTNPLWQEKMAYLLETHLSIRDKKCNRDKYRIDILAALNQFDKALRMSIPDKDRIMLLISRADLLYLADDYQAVQRCVSDIIDRCRARNIQECGFGMHKCYTILGKLAMKEGDIASATKYLKKSILDPESITLSPDLSLAQIILDNGDSGVVLGFLEACKTTGYLSGEIMKWENSIRNGKTVVFDSLSTALENAKCK